MNATMLEWDADLMSFKVIPERFYLESDIDFINKGYDQLGYDNVGVLDECGIFEFHRASFYDYRHIRTHKQIRANYFLNNAIRDGKIMRADCCSNCGLECSAHGHHPDYSNPYEVIWLCRKCHLKLHKEQRIEKIAMFKM